ncbi:MAG: hypothetical protein Q9191_004492 [Dirinaria sp. TL-2023a]
MNYLLAYNVLINTISCVVAHLSGRDDVEQGTELRILPLGSSITIGQGSSDGNGYRLFLQDNLNGSKIQYVGSLREGTMADNFNEGYSGYTIRPNIVLLHEGTNDLDRDPPIPGSSEEGAPDRLGALLDEIVTACPDAAVLVAQIIQARDPKVQARIERFNNAIPGVVAQRVKQGHHILVVDMRTIEGDQLRDDGIHPTDEGYKLMANHWYTGIKEAAAEGWIKPPIGPDPICGAARGSDLQTRNGPFPGHYCLSLPIWDETGRLTHGVGINGPAKFFPSWTERGIVFHGIGKKGLDARSVQFRDLDGDGRDDYVWIDPHSGGLIVHLSEGDQTHYNWQPANNGKPVASGLCPPARLRLPDLTGSGTADYVCIDDKTGRIDVWFNKYLEHGGWKWNGPHRISDGVPGGNRNSILFGDINGDGRDDLLVRGPKGSLHCWLNLGKLHTEEIFLHEVGQIASGTGTSNITLADINGDGRDDVLIWRPEGGITGFLNVRGLKEGFPIWVHQAHIKKDIGVHWQDIRIGDLNGDGKADYVVVNDDNGAARVFQNDGRADTSRAGDSTRMADLDGGEFNPFSASEKLVVSIFWKYKAGKPS